MFEIVRRGYNQKQVGDFVLKVNKIITELRSKNAELGNEISDLEEEVSQLKIKDEESQVFLQKAIENENNLKKLLDLEAKKIDDLIEKWLIELNNVRTKYGEIPEVEKQARAFQKDIEKTTQKIIDLNTIKKEKNEDKVYHRQLLNQMRDMQAVNEMGDDKQSKNEASLVEKSEKEDYTSLVNKYLGDIDTTITDFSFQEEKPKITQEEKPKALKAAKPKIAAVQNYPEPNSSGFDLKEAVNPKESLEDIMSSFDFYNPEENTKKKRKIK